MPTREYYQKNKEKMAEYREKNKEKTAEYNKQYRKKNKEKTAEYNKQYREKNKERLAAQQKEWQAKNKEKVSEIKKRYKQTPAGIKSNTITKWKMRGLICDDYIDLYDKYLASTNCEECGVEYGAQGDGTRSFKCMDHDHETGSFRNFLCCNCNLKRR